MSAQSNAELTVEASRRSPVEGRGLYPIIFGQTNFMENVQTWYIIKRREGKCEILPDKQIEGEQDSF